MEKSEPFDAVTNFPSLKEFSPLLASPPSDSVSTEASHSLLHRHQKLFSGVWKEQSSVTVSPLGLSLPLSHPPCPQPVVMEIPVVLQELSHSWPIIWICSFPTPGEWCSLSPPCPRHSNSVSWTRSHSCFLLCYSAIPARCLQRRTDNILNRQGTEVLWTPTETMRHQAYWQWARNTYILLKGKPNGLYHAFGNSRPYLYSFLLLSSLIEYIVNLLDSYIKKIIKLDIQVLQEVILVNLF